MTPRRTALVVLATAAIVTAYVAVTNVIPTAAAGALLHPMRRPVTERRPANCLDVEYRGEGVTLRGWRCDAASHRRGTLVFMHGIGDNRASVVGAIDRFVVKGFDVVAYDSRAQGESTGDACTYGYWEKRDLHYVLDAVSAGPVLLLGTSLGGAVALQEAADDSRVIGVVAAEVFSDLRTVAQERAPRVLTQGIIRRAFSIAERRGDFRIDEVSPVEAARRIRIPVLLIHGSQDTDTPPDHSRRVLAALAGPKELLLVEGARHNESLRSPETWQRIDRWVAENVEQHAR
jgi:uncharacterized protein